MKAILRILFLLSVILILGSCGQDKDKYALFGKTNAYESWLWHKYTPQKMERHLDLEWNDACKSWLKDKPITIAVYKTDDDGMEVPAKDVMVYKNDVLCEGNSFNITTKETEVKFALEFKDDATDGEHIYSLKYIPNGGDRETLDEVSFEAFGQDNKLLAEKETIMNPLKEKVIWGGCIILAIIIVWYILSRFMLWPSTSFSNIYIDYNDGYGDTKVKTIGCYEVVLTNNPKMDDGAFEKIFKGKRAYIRHEFWTEPITIKDGRRSKSIDILGARNYDIEGEKLRKNEIHITNSDCKKVTIRTT